MILGLGIPELLVILIVVLLIFGPKNLPKIGSALGKTVKNVREGMEGDDEEEKPAKAVPAAESEAPVIVEDDEDEDADADADVVFCSKCGAENAADAAFCSKCGNKLA